VSHSAAKRQRKEGQMDDTGTALRGFRPAEQRERKQAEAQAIWPRLIGVGGRSGERRQNRGAQSDHGVGAPPHDFEYHHRHQPVPRQRRQARRDAADSENGCHEVCGNRVERRRQVGGVEVRPPHHSNCRQAGHDEGDDLVVRERLRARTGDARAEQQDAEYGQQRRRLLVDGLDQPGRDAATS
jgi:hypothetical protein